MFLVSCTGCSNEKLPRPADASDRTPREAVVEAPKRMDNGAPYRAKLTHGAELYIPPWFSPSPAGYDVIIHFHGLGKLQEANLERSQINAAVVSINHGVGTEGYSNHFRDAQSFPKLLEETQAEIDKSGRAPSSKIRRVALSAWSAGFVSVSQILREPANGDKVDAVLLADGFFTSFTDPKKRVINTTSLERFVALVDQASKNDKLFGITHTAIPTQNYPSVEETVAKLLEMTSSAKTATNVLGPRKMVETYVVDRGSFHVKGYEGILAGDHIRQIHAMGETLWPYLKTRWDASSAPAKTDK
ncbi:MAG: hypothetical protein KF819_24425 [Labilithrix sp.]|nr:hypothetical protein [Labilithrix sp.]